MLIAISQFHGHNTSQHVIGLIYIVAIISCLMTYQIYGMVAFDIMNIKYTASWKKERCLRWLQIFIRLLFGGLTFFLISVAFTFLGYLLPLIGGFVSVPLTETTSYKHGTWMLWSSFEPSFCCCSSVEFRC